MTARPEFYEWDLKEYPNSTFEYWDLKELFEVFKKMKPSEIQGFNQFLKRIYTILSKGDREMLSRLDSKLGRYTNGSTPRAKMISGLSHTISNLVLPNSRDY